MKKNLIEMFKEAKADGSQESILKLVEAAKNLTKDIEWFPAERQATEHAEYSLNRFSREELKKIESFYVLKSINPDPESDNHWDGNIVWEADIAAELDK